MHWVHCIVHGWVIPHKVNHFIWIVLSGLHVGSEGTSRTLQERERERELKQACSTHRRACGNVWILIFHGACVVFEF